MISLIYWYLGKTNGKMEIQVYDWYLIRRVVLFYLCSRLCYVHGHTYADCFLLSSWVCAWPYLCRLFSTFQLSLCMAMLMQIVFYFPVEFVHVSLLKFKLCKSYLQESVYLCAFYLNHVRWVYPCDALCKYATCG